MSSSSWASSSAAQQLLRSALVFAVGALDAYLHDLILEIVPKHISDPSPALKEGLREITKKDPVLALRVALASDEKARIQEIYSALDEWLSIESFQGPARVQKALEYLGCKLVWNTVDREIQFKTASELQRITQKRHNIVHRGREHTITKDEAQAAIDLVRALAKYIDHQVCKANGLPTGPGQ